jgi:hypothetical protein
MRPVDGALKLLAHAQESIKQWWTHKKTLIAAIKPEAGNLVLDYEHEAFSSELLEGDGGA